MITKEISAQVRKSFGKSPMRQLRIQGKTPGIVYGGGKEALPIEFETRLIFHELIDIRGRNAILTLKIDDGSQRSVLVKEIQTDPVNGSLYHADFLDIDVDKSAKFAVPINYVGKAKGVDLGGILEIGKKQITLEGKPLAMPDSCDVDISQMKIGDKVTAGSIELPEGVKLVNKPETVCVAVVAPIA